MPRDPRPLVDELADLLAADASVDEVLRHADARAGQGARRSAGRRERRRPRESTVRTERDERSRHEAATGENGTRTAPDAAAVATAVRHTPPSRARPTRKPLRLGLPVVRWRVSTGAMIGLLLAGATVVVMIGLLSPTSGARTPSNPEHRAAQSSPEPDSHGGVPVAGQATSAGATPTPSSAKIFVHVLGAVARPGLYELTPEARIADALVAAGGAGAEAELASVNLARHVSDGEQIRVLSRGEVAGPAGSTSGGGAGGAASSAGAGAVAGGGGSMPAARVNLNTATLEQLVTLPRIGPAIAQRIIRHRERNGPFASVDDLGEVAGIGDATLAALRDLVAV